MFHHEGPLVSWSLMPCGVVCSLHVQVSRQEMIVRAVEQISERHDFARGFVVAGHSFGSICAAWLCKALPQRVKQMVLIDPVCLLLW
jgi:pimeloyl-ACP methyl ester carboxylesterase